MENNIVKDLKEKLFFKRKNVSDYVKEQDLREAFEFSENYKNFLNCSRDEIKTSINITKILKASGFKNFKQVESLKKGDKFYFVNKGKAVICGIIGEKLLNEGINIVASHIDSPRLDLKPKPLYEQEKTALLNTQYYGGIKTYQWTCIPLCLLGTVYKKDNTKVNISIGLNESDPVFCISDLLPHLAGKQITQKMSNAIEGESLNALCGLFPFLNSKEEDLVKLNVLNILYNNYGICEEDFISAELKLIPAFKAKDVGFDKSMVGAYGQDDKVCAFASLSSMLNSESIQKTAILVFADKEETGSIGNTGLDSEFLKQFLEDLNKFFNTNLNEVLKKSNCISADVTAAFDVNYKDVFEEYNSAFLNNGLTLNKYVGGKGKSSSSEASGSYISKIRNILDKNKIVWQACELGKVDAGGGGTLSSFLSRLNINVVDMGVCILSMHSPFEVTSKLDIFMLYKFLKCFLED